MWALIYAANMHMAPLFVHRKSLSHLHLPSPIPNKAFLSLLLHHLSSPLKKAKAKRLNISQNWTIYFWSQIWQYDQEIFWKKKKVLGISCFFVDNEFRKDDLLPPSLKKKCLPTLLFSNPNWYDNIQEVNIWKWVLKKKTTHTQKTIFLPSKCNFKFQRQDLGQWFGSFFILPKLGHPSLIVQFRGIRKMSGNKNPARKKKLEYVLPKVACP